MPATNPRVTVTLKPATQAQLREISRLTGSSQSSLVSELLEQSGPVFDRLIKLLKAAEAARSEVSSKVVENLGRAQSRIETQLGLALDDFDALSTGLLADAESIRRRARRAPVERPGAPPVPAGVGGLTPLSNRGVRLGPKKRKSSTATRG